MSNSKKVEAMLAKLKRHDVDMNSFENNLTVIVEANIDEVDGILDTLRNMGMSLEENISILKYTTSKRLNEIIEFMRGKGVKERTIAKELKSVVIDEKKLRTRIEDVYERGKSAENTKKDFKNFRKYMRLMGMYERYYTREDIESLCTERNITIREFVEEIVCPNMNKNNDIIRIYYEKIMEGGRLYVGPAKPIGNEYLEEHSEEILELSRIAAKKFAANKPQQDLDELSGFALEIIVSKCGNLVDNLQGHSNALRGSIVNRAARYLYSTVERNRPVSITQKFTNKEGKTIVKDNEYSHDVNGNPYEYDTGLQGVIDYEKAEFNTNETEVMECMITLIEAGEADDLYRKVAESLVMEEDDVIEIIRSIRHKMIQNQLVKEQKRGGYEFYKREEDDDINLS